MRRWLAAFALAATTALASHEIRIDPGSQVLDGEPVHVRVVGAPPGAQVKLIAVRWYVPVSTRPQAPRLMRSEAIFTADARGEVDLRTSPALEGTYRGVDPRGPFWSMVPANVVSADPRSIDTTEVRFAAHVGEVHSQARVKLLPALREVRTIAAKGLPGAVFASLPGEGKRPAIVLLGGSEGGSLVTLAAASFASHGFAVLAMPVFSPPDREGRRELADLPDAWVDMPVEVLDRARDWLAQLPEVDADRIAVHGTSMGAVLALLGAVHRPWVKAVVASVPSDVVWDGWGPGIKVGTRSTFTVAGEPLPFVAPIGYEEEVRGYERKEPVLIRRAFDRGRAASAERAAQARIPVERIRVPVMVIGADDDQMWASGPMARNIVETRRAAGLATEAFIFRDAGHLLYDTGYAPTTGYNAGLRKTGGTPETNARAQAEAWVGVIRFLKRALGEPGPK